MKAPTPRQTTTTNKEVVEEVRKEVVEEFLEEIVHALLLRSWRRYGRRRLLG